MNFKSPKNLKVILILVAILGVVWFVGQEKIRECFLQEEGLSSQAVANLAVDYINQNMLAGGVTASLLDVVEESGLYKIHIQIEDEEYDSYVSKDGRFLFPQNWIDLKEESAEEEMVEKEMVEEETNQYSEEELVNLANCLTEKGFKFYGAFWCSYCNQEKEIFGSAAQYLPYIECSDEETQEMTPVCVEAGIEGFPTWGLPDGTKSSGFKSLEELAKLSGCSL